MNDRKHNHICAQLQSWETGYISPSAQMVIKDARLYIEELRQQIHDLEFELATLKGKRDVGELDEIEF